MDVLWVTAQAVVQVWDGFAVAADPRLQIFFFPLASGHLLRVIESEITIADIYVWSEFTVHLNFLLHF